VFAVDGTSAAAVAQIQSFDGPGVFLGVFTLVADPSFPNQLSSCQSSGISVLRMTGVEVFQDPAL